jgi:pre-mRNA-splicing factor SPF27
MAPEEAMMALPAPTTLMDALPYVDSQYNDAQMKKRVDQLVQAEMKTFAPRDYVAHLPQYEPNFEVRARGPWPRAGHETHRVSLLLRQDHPLLQAEWMRICDQQPMSRIDTSRYALDPPPVAKQADPQAWRRAVENAEAQHEHQNTRSAPAACSKHVAAPLPHLRPQSTRLACP